MYTLLAVGSRVASLATTLSLQRGGLVVWLTGVVSVGKTLNPACRSRSDIQASVIRADCVSLVQAAEIILLCTAAPIRMAMAPAMIDISVVATRISTTVRP